MVITQLVGGLGNQLFQYAVGRRLALVRGADLKLDLSPFETYKRPYALGHFDVVHGIATASETARFVGRAPTARARRLWDRFKPRSRRSVLRERGLRFDPTVLAASANVYLAGYWQTERYFADVADVIRREVTVSAPPDSTNAALAASIRSTTSVAVTVRRGDYLSDPVLSRYLPTCPPEYYHAAVDRVLAAVARPHFFVFSEDPAWAQAHLHLPDPTTFVTHNGPDRTHETFRLMSFCRHHIIANSSFSWWGAWLAEQPGQVVIAPERWFTHPEADARGVVHPDYDATDMIPDRWIRL